MASAGTPVLALSRPGQDGAALMQAKKIAGRLPKYAKLTADTLV